MKNLWRSALALLILACLALDARASLDSGLTAVEKQDWAAALAAFQPLAEQGVAAAEVNLGNLYMKGLGVEQDYRAAFRWYLKAAEQGDAMGRSKLGLLHYYGLGVEENHAEAARWFREAAEQGDAGAQAILGSLYSQGDGVPADKVQAYFWYSLAAEQQVEGALENRDGLAEAMNPGEMEEALTRLAEWRKRHEPEPSAEDRDKGEAAGKQSAKPKAGRESARKRK